MIVHGPFKTKRRNQLCLDLWSIFFLPWLLLNLSPGPPSSTPSKEEFSSLQWTPTNPSPSLKQAQMIHRRKAWGEGSHLSLSRSNPSLLLPLHGLLGDPNPCLLWESMQEVLWGNGGNGAGLGFRLGGPPSVKILRSTERRLHCWAAEAKALGSMPSTRSGRSSGSLSVPTTFRPPKGLRMTLSATPKTLMMGRGVKIRVFIGTTILQILMLSSLQWMFLCSQS